MDPTLLCQADVVISFSGGKDSCAMLEYICTTYSDTRKHIVLADTGWEHDEIVTWCEERVARYGLPLHVVRNPHKDFFSMVRARGKFPAPGIRNCTSDLKTGPIHKWIRHHCGSLIVNAMGLRAEESAGRASKKPWSVNSQSNSKRIIYDWLPIHDWSERQVIEYLIDRDIPLHPAYQYLNRLSCQVCIFSSKTDLQAIKHHNPVGFQRIVDLEREIGFTMKSTGSLEQETQ